MQGACSDKALVVHLSQDRVSAPGRIIWMVDGGVPSGNLDNTCQQRTFRQCKVIEGFVEVKVCGRGDTIGSVAHINLITVKCENLLFGVVLLNFQGKKHILDFALNRFLGPGKEEFAQLHGEG